MAGQKAPEASLVLAKGAFRLPALAIAVFGEVLLHEPAVLAGRTCIGGPAAYGGDYAFCAKGLSYRLVVVLGIVTCVAKKGFEAMVGKALLGRNCKFPVVRIWPLAGNCRQVDVALCVHNGS